MSVTSSSITIFSVFFFFLLYKVCSSVYLCVCVCPRAYLLVLLVLLVYSLTLGPSTLTSYLCRCEVYLPRFDKLEANVDAFTQARKHSYLLVIEKIYIYMNPTIFTTRWSWKIFFELSIQFTTSYIFYIIYLFVN